MCSLHRSLSRSALLLIVLPAVMAFGQTGDYLSEVASARNEVIQTDALTITKLELGDPHPGKNRFTAVVQSKTDSILTLGLDLRAEPGVWPYGWQVQSLFLVWPRQTREIETEYDFKYLSPEGSLRVAFFFPQVVANGVTEFGSSFFRKKYLVGKGNKAVDYDVAKRFQEHDSEHFHVYFLPASLAARNLDAICQEREAAFQKVTELLGTTYPVPIRLFYFPDSETKTRETGHTGAGWSFKNTIVEIYNEQTKLDPYHELAHILAGQLGDPPALFNEGFAVYVSELMGADALKELGSPGRKIDDVVASLRSEGKFLPLDTVFALNDIGPEESHPTVSYPEAASFVKFLITTHGLDMFRQAYKSLQNGNDPATVEKNRQTFREIYGKLPAEIEREWLNSLGSASR